MMDVFTDAQTPTRVSRAFATLPPAPVPDESSGATATTPPSSPAYNINSYSPSQYCKPATPTNSTPLHRRFLRSISMSPAIPSPSTPTPNSPAKTRPTPAHRKSESPIKLEVGPGVFYFSIALPASKITPKKGGTPGSKATTPGRDAGTQGTPTKTPTVKELAARYHGTAGDFGTPTRSSPLKHASPVKEIPATPGTPTKRTRSLAKHSPLRPPFGTPKSIRTPRSETGSDTGTLTQRTPTTRSTSPLKDHSPGKRSPARALFGTLTKKGTVRTPNGSRPGSPVKRTIERLPTEPEKKVSKRAKELLSTPTERLRIPPECLVDVTEDEALSQVRLAANLSRQVLECESHLSSISFKSLFRLYLSCEHILTLYHGICRRRLPIHLLPRRRLRVGHPSRQDGCRPSHIQRTLGSSWRVSGTATLLGTTIVESPTTPAGPLSHLCLRHCAEPLRSSVWQSPLLSCGCRPIRLPVKQMVT
jgi:hypothetical protein